MTDRYIAQGRTIFRKILEPSENPFGLYGDNGIRFVTVDGDIDRVDIVETVLNTGEAAYRAGPGSWSGLEAIRATLAASGQPGADQLAQDLQAEMDALAAAIPSFKDPAA